MKKLIVCYVLSALLVTSVVPSFATSSVAKEVQPKTPTKVEENIKKNNFLIFN